ncbi:MAG: Mur ligase domain-containing protein [Nocardioides sp.]|nr:Mur ligase domain-containing protein [Nocardioides sp.]
MIPMTLDEIGRVVGGTLADANGATTVTGAAFLDSRHAEPGGLFVAVAGERVDGHEYAAAAVASGAAAVLGARPTGVPTVVVTDPRAAWAELARHLIDSLPDLTVLALTGSQGKTGTKDYLAQILAAAGPTAATVGNLNNEIGVPLTVLTARRDTRFLVVEMGARGIGHIAFLCKIAPPQIGAVLNVGTAHLSEFGSREAIARAKREILEALPAEGVAVVNADNEFTAAMAGRGPASTMTFGEAPGSDVTWRDVSYDDLGRPTAEFDIAGERARISLTQAGEHQLHNAAAAAAMAHAAGVGVATIRHALEEATSLSRWRM